MKKYDKGDWNSLNSERQKGLLEKIWPQHIKDLKENRDIYQDVLKAKK